MPTLTQEPLDLWWDRFVSQYADSNAPITPAGTSTIGWTFSTSTNWIANYFSIPPAPPPPTTITTYTYDPDGQLLSTYTSATASSTFVYNYLHQITKTVINGLTTTYGSDLASRVYQATGSTTTFYPSPYNSYTLTYTGATTTLATSTDYAYAGPLLLGTFEQAYVNASSTGNVLKTYLTTDNLGSLVAAAGPTGSLLS